METYTFTMGMAWRIATKQPAESIAKWAVPQIQRLGPIQLKLAQMLSVRRDVFPESVIKELSAVQKNNKELQMSLVDVVSILMTEHGEDFVYDLKIEEPPLGIASIGQVHKARHKDGRVMAIKVQRNLSERDIQRTFGQLYFLGMVIDLVNPSARSHTSMVLKEYKDVLYEELDFEQEAMNAMTMKEHFKDIPYVTIPDVYFSTKRSIGYEYVPGIPIDHLEELEQTFDTKVLANRVYKMYLRQIFETSFFHCDLHGGNISIDPSNGNVILYDFGMVGQVTVFMRESFTRLITAIYTKDDSMLMYSLQDLHIISSDAKLRNVRSSLDFLLGLALKSSSISPETLQKKISKIPKENFTIPSELVFWFRSVSFLQSIVVKLDPEYDFETPLKKYITNTSTLESLTKGFIQASNTTYKLEKGFDSVKHSLQSLEGLQSDVWTLKGFVQALFAVLLLQSFLGESVMTWISLP